MGLDDIAEVSDLEREVFSDAWSTESFVAEVERRQEIGCPLVLRDDDGTLLGYSVVWFIVDEIHIGNIAIRPDRQGEGLGSALLAHVIDEGRRRGMAFATLEVRPSNGPAMALYRRFGFTKVAVRKNYYRDNREDALVLACPLNAVGKRRLG